MNFGFEHGGVLWAKTLLKNLATLQGFEICVVLSGSNDAWDAGHRFFGELGVDCTFIQFHKDETPAYSRGAIDNWVAALRNIPRILSDKYFFWGESECRKQRHVDAELMKIVTSKRPDVLLIESMYSAFFVPSAFCIGTPCCVITQDNDIPFYVKLKAQGGLTSMGRAELWMFQHFNWISNIRVRRKLNWIYQRCSGLVTLSGNDIPTDLPGHVVRAAIAPVLRRRELRWRYQNSGCLLFVGGIVSGKALHFANRLAIKWLCTQLAPELSRLGSEFVINIIGASELQVPKPWRCSNIRFLGRADRSEVERQMTTADLFVAPIESNFGAKMKLAECVAHGMPFIATPAAMSGLPFLTSIPVIDLSRPGAAARLVLDYTSSPETLIALSESVVSQSEQAYTDQSMAWDRVLMRLVRPSVDRVDR